MLHLCCALMVHSVCTARNWRCISKWRCRSFQQRFYWVSISWAGGVRKNSTLDSWNPVTLDLCKSGSSLETLPRICKFLQIVDNPQFFCVATIRTSIHPKLTWRTVKTPYVDTRQRYGIWYRYVLDWRFSGPKKVSPVLTSPCPAADQPPYQPHLTRPKKHWQRIATWCGTISICNHHELAVMFLEYFNTPLNGSSMAILIEHLW